ncbi:unnamed protein product [Brassica napus]|uniref:(rape) hypothetical protein n=1 Tax=Brassica napus TaxID=3708 RepID=A0A816Q9K4_BRANA|nr:unnamed protein product [Brassica napus]
MVQKTSIFGFLCKKHNSPINVKEEKKIAGEEEKSSKTSPSSRILSSSSSPYILADVILVAVSQIHLRRSPSSP